MYKNLVILIALFYLFPIILLSEMFIDMKIGITTAIVIYKGDGVKKNGKYPVKLRIIHERRAKYFRIGLDLTLEDWEKVEAPRPKGEYKAHSLYCRGCEDKAIQIIEKMAAFSFEEFRRLFYKKRSDKGNIFYDLEMHMKALKEAGKMSTWDTYRNTANKLKKFVKKDNLQYGKITPKFLMDFEKYMYEEGRKTNTIAIYMRCIRRIWNLAIQEKRIDKDLYPFDKYHVPSSENFKRALSKENIKKILEYKPESPQEQWAKDMFVFSYLGNGMNMADIWKLKPANIIGDKIVFYRAKTASKRKKGKPVVIQLRDTTKEIIERYRSKGEYLFLILQKGLTPQQEKQKIHQGRKQVNKYLRRICEKIGIEDITTYYARHSFASVLRDSGVNITDISELLGHKSVKTTQIYLDSLQDDKLKDISDKLEDL